MISKDTIALVRERTDIVARRLARACPTLKKRGRRFLGLCPFHKEKTPSFNVNPDSGVYHCFGCKESGDAITFLERAEGYTFPEAVRALAERAGIPIEEERGAAADRGRAAQEGARGALRGHATWPPPGTRSSCASHPQRRTRSTSSRAAGSTPDDAGRAGLPRRATRPPAGTGWRRSSRSRGSRRRSAESVGLARAALERHRVLRPLPPPADVRGHRRAGPRRRLQRARARADPPRATRTRRATRRPSTSTRPRARSTSKGAHLFGLWQARHAIRQEEQAILVEGNFDVVSLHARGVANVVAPLGHGVHRRSGQAPAPLRRRRHAALRRRRGRAQGGARGRGARATSAGLDAKVAILPEKTDPDEFVRTKGAGGAPATSLGQARGLLEYLIDVELDASFNAADSREKAARVERVGAIIARQKDPCRRGMLKAYADTRSAGSIWYAPPPMRSGPQAPLRSSQARAARVDFGPRPSEARVKPRPPGQRGAQGHRRRHPRFPGTSRRFRVSRPCSTSSRATRHGSWRRSPSACG